VVDAVDELLHGVRSLRRVRQVAQGDGAQVGFVGEDGGFHQYLSGSVDSVRRFAWFLDTKKPPGPHPGGDWPRRPRRRERESAASAARVRLPHPGQGRGADKSAGARGGGVHRSMIMGDRPADPNIVAIQVMLQPPIP
jgi:hypothetical protein